MSQARRETIARGAAERAGEPGPRAAREEEYEEECGTSYS